MKKCIPLLRPHQWRRDGYNEVDDILILRCEKCGKFKVSQGWPGG